MALKDGGHVQIQ